MLTTFALALGLIVVAVAVMSIGLLSRNRCLRGSCGGPEVLDSQGESLRCGACPRSDEEVDRSSSQTTLPPVTSTTEPVT